MISNRLKSLVKYIKKNDLVIDIGCDHALLDIYLVKHDYLDNLIVSDVHELALQSGIDNIKKYNLEDKIETRLGNGLEVLSENDNINTVLISGMGANTILNILNNDYLSNIEKIILQSNNDHYLLRKSICSMGYKILDEDYIFDNDKYYVNIVFVKGNISYKEDDYKYGPILKGKGKEYYNYLKDKHLEILKGIPDKSLRKKEILCIIKELEKLI